mgnify:FL=1
MKILLISDNKELFNLTRKSINSEHELIWENYASITSNKYLYSDVVILHFTQIMLEKGILNSLVKMKTKLGALVPILAVVEGGTPQQLFSVLKVGAYDYVDILCKEQDIYREKISNIIMWKWYLEKYRK